MGTLNHTTGRYLGMAAVLMIGFGSGIVGAMPQGGTSATARPARDTLPLAHGFYVEASTACGSAIPNEAVLYEGRALGPTRGMTCRIEQVKRGTATWFRKTTCEKGPYDPVFESEQTIRVTSRETFDDIKPASAGGDTYHYRLCRQSEIASPLNTVEVR